MCLKFAQKVTKFPAQPIVKFSHTDYFNMSQYEKELHYNQCKLFATEFSEGLYPITDCFDNIYDAKSVRDTIDEYANNTFDNADIGEYIASDIEYFMMQDNIDYNSNLISRTNKWLNNMNCALLALAQ